MLSIDFMLVYCPALPWSYALLVNQDLKNQPLYLHVWDIFPSAYVRLH